MEERLRVLKVMSEATGRMDLNEFARVVELHPSQTMERLQELVKAGLVKKVGGGYGITEKGKAVLKAFTPVSEDMAFHFYVGVGQPTGFAAESLKDFYEVVKQVVVDSVEFHLYREDFENWIRTIFKEAAFVGELANMRKAQLKGENLRKEIIEAMEARYGFEKML